jgi:hypothetical protein
MFIRLWSLCDKNCCGKLFLVGCIRMKNEVFFVLEILEVKYISIWYSSGACDFNVILKQKLLDDLKFTYFQSLQKLSILLIVRFFRKLTVYLDRFKNFKVHYGQIGIVRSVLHHNNKSILSCWWIVQY